MRFGKISINIENKEVMKDFYHNTLKLVLIEETTEFLRFGFDNKKVMIELVVIDDPDKQKVNTLYHYAILLPNRQALGSFLGRLLDVQYQKIEGAADHLVSEALYIQDPEGNTIEIYADRDSATWEWENGQVKMDSLPLAANDLLALKEPWNGFPSGTIIGHLHFYGASVEKADQFFVEMLGQSLVSQFGDAAHFYSYQQYHHHFALNIWQGTHHPNRTDSNLGLTMWEMFVSQEIYDNILAHLESRHIDYHVDQKLLSFEDAVGSTIVIGVDDE